MTPRIPIGIVAYRPDDKALDRLQRILDFGAQAYVYDNSPDEPLLRDFCRAHAGRITYLTCGKNLGLGLAITSVCAQAYYDGHAALLFFDQDSIFTHATLEFIEAFVRDRPEVASTHAVVSFTSRPAPATAHGSYDLRELPLTINSGSLYYLQSAKSLGWHNEHYFVDGVDYEYCLRAHLHGLKVAECNGTPGFDHLSEQGDLPVRWFGKPRLMRKYSPLRIKDSTKANLRLIATSLRHLRFDFAYRFSRILAGYLLSQLVVRIAATPNTASPT
jgi:rhamnosyltransferase